MHSTTAMIGLGLTIMPTAMATAVEQLRETVHTILQAGRTNNKVPGLATAMAMAMALPSANITARVTASSIRLSREDGHRCQGTHTWTVALPMTGRRKKPTRMGVM
jgi:hypothetical protein